MSKKNASLAALATAGTGTPEPPQSQPETRKIQPPPKPEADDTKASKRLFVYMAPAVHRQLRQLAFDENRTMSSLFLQGIDMVFKQHGLQSTRELTGKDPE